MGLSVFAGHGLNYRNIDGITTIAEIEELNIGHSIVARAALVGLEAAVRGVIALMLAQQLEGGAALPREREQQRGEGEERPRDDGSPRRRRGGERAPRAALHGAERRARAADRVNDERDLVALAER